MRFLAAVLLVALAGNMGCGKKGSHAPGEGEALRHAPAQAKEMPQLPPGAAKPDTALPRKIKYTADLRLIVEDLGKSSKDLKQLVKDHKGHVAQAEDNSSPGTIRQAHWRIRVPVDQFDPFREAVLQLGQVEKNTIDSEDVTEEYYDLKNHIKNRLAAEENLREILKKTDNIDNFLKVNDKLDLIRDEINRKEGRLKALENLTELTTVTVALREKQKYDPDKPPDVAEKPSFGQRISRTFDDSLEMLSHFGQGLVLVLVGLGPWLVPLAVIVLPLAWLVRRYRGATAAAVRGHSSSRRNRPSAREEEGLEIIEEAPAKEPPQPPPAPSA